MTSASIPDAGDDTDRITISMISDLDEAEELAPAWLELAIAHSAQPTMTPGYSLPWWKHLGAGELRLFAAHRKDELVGVAPLHARTLAARWRTLRWLGHGTGSVGHVVADPADLGVRRALWSSIGRGEATFDLVDVPVDEVRFLDGFLARGGSLNRRADNRCPIAELEPGWTLDDYLSGGIRRRARRNLVRSENRLAEVGAVSDVRCVSEWRDVDQVLADVLTVYDAAEHEQDRIHFLSGDYAHFFRAFLERAAAAGQLDILVAYVNGRPAAFDVMMTVGDTSHTILGRYHPEARDWGVGHVLMRAMAERALARGSRRFNLQIGDDSYKRAWAETGEDLVHIVGAEHPAGIRLVNARYVAFDLAAKLRSRVADRL